jgi:recombination protein RecR
LNSYSSKILEQAVNELAKLPGIGRKTALRLALYLLRQKSSAVELLSESLLSMSRNIHFCNSCHNISDQETCEICLNTKRDHSVICVVEDIRDIMAIENTSQFRGIYHVLNGIISPVEGIGPGDLHIETLVAKVEKGDVSEIIFALPTTIEGDTTSFYLYKQLQQKDIKVTTIARGVAIGDDLEYTDEVTLGRSILNRTPYMGSDNDDPN